MAFKKKQLRFVICQNEKKKKKRQKADFFFFFQSLKSGKRVAGKRCFHIQGCVFRARITLRYFWVHHSNIRVKCQVQASVIVCLSHNDIRNVKRRRKISEVKPISQRQKINNFCLASQTMKKHKG